MSSAKIDTVCPEGPTDARASGRSLIGQCPVSLRLARAGEHPAATR